MPRRLSIRRPGNRSLRVLLLCALALLSAPSAAFAAVAFRASSSASATVGGDITIASGTRAERRNCGDITPAIPAGSVGDLLLTQVIARRNAATVTMSGWNSLFSDNVAGTNYQVFLFWRSATGTDPNTVNQSGACNQFMATITRFGNVDPVQPLETQPLPAGNWAYTNAGDVDTGSQTISVANSLLVLATFVADDRTVTQDGSFSQLYDVADNSGLDAGFSLNYRIEASPGSTGPFLNMDLSGNGNDPNHGVLFAVRPAANGLSINKPAGTVADDVMVAAITVSPGTVGITPPSGWTVVQDTVQTEDAGSHLITYYKVASGSEPADYTWSFSGNHSGAVGGISTFSGVDTANPIVSSASQLENGNTATTHAAPSITAAADDMLVTVHEYQSSGTWTPPAGMTEAIDRYSRAATGAGGVSLEMNFLLLTSTGATGTKAATASNNGDEGASQALALSPPRLCFTDNFDGALIPNWSVGQQGGTFTPAIIGSRLRLTDASIAAGTWATLGRIFPGAGNKVTAEFDHYAYGGTGGDGIALVLSNAAIPPVAGAFGGSMGYAQKGQTPVSDCTEIGGCPGFAGGWLGIALDEYGNYSTSIEGRVGGLSAAVPDSVAIRGSGSGMSGYRYLVGTGSLSPGVDNNGSTSPPHRYRITVDHTDNIHGWVSVERDTTGGGTSYTTLIGCPPDQIGNCASALDVKDAGYGQDPVPANWYFSLTGASGASANIHEIDSLTVCTEQTQVTPSLHHIRLEHPGQACTGASNPAQVTVKACADATCSSLYLGSVTVDLSNVATWSVDPVSFSGGQTTLTLTRNTAGTVTLGGTATDPTASSATRCFSGATETCSLTFSACAFDVIEANAAAYTPIYTKLSGTSFNLDVLRLGGAGTITVNRVEIVDASSGVCSGYTSLADSTTAVPSGFTSTQRKSFAFSYDNAVRDARIRVTYSTNQYVCSSDNFAIRPQAFTVTSTATQTGSSGTPVFRAGADTFAFTATALPGYDGVPKLDASKLSSALPHLGLFGAVTFPIATKATGVATAVGFTYSEVGNFSFLQYAVYDDGFAVVDATKTPPECTSDFNNGPVVNGRYGCMFGSDAVGPFGRFVPHHFTVVGALANACVAGGFTYMGQPFSLFRLGDPSKAELVEARNFAEVLTRNYAGAYAMGTVNFGAENADNGTDLSSRLAFYSNGTYPALSGSWTNGVYTMSGNDTNAAFKRPTAANPDPSWGPFESLDLGLTVADSDLITSPQVSNADMNPTTSGTVSLSYKKFSGSPLRILYGRIFANNTFGSDTETLVLPVVARYYDGSGTSPWQKNDDDSCSTYTYGAPVQTGITAETVPISPVTLVAGLGSLSLSPTADPLPLGGTLAFTFDFPGWLEPDQSATASFGIRRGNDRVINWREIMR